MSFTKTLGNLKIPNKHVEFSNILPLHQKYNFFFVKILSLQKKYVDSFLRKSLGQSRSKDENGGDENVMMDVWTY